MVQPHHVPVETIVFSSFCKRSCQIYPEEQLDVAIVLENTFVRYLLYITCSSVPVLYITDCTSGLPGVGLTGWAARDAARYTVFYPSNKHYYFCCLSLECSWYKQSLCLPHTERRKPKKELKEMVVIAVVAGGEGGGGGASLMTATKGGFLQYSLVLWLC